MDSLVNLLLVVVLFGLTLGLVNRFLPMPPLIKSLLNLLVFVILVIYILQYFGVVPNVLPMAHWYPLQVHPQ